MVPSGFAEEGAADDEGATEEAEDDDLGQPSLTVTWTDLRQERQEHQKWRGGDSALGGKTHGAGPALISIVREDGDHDLVAGLEGIGDVPGHGSTLVVAEVGTARRSVSASCPGHASPTYMISSQGFSVETMATLKFLIPSTFSQLSLTEPHWRIAGVRALLLV